MPSPSPTPPPTPSSPPGGVCPQSNKCEKNGGVCVLDDEPCDGKRIRSKCRGPKPPPPVHSDGECCCEGKVTRLALRYRGDASADVRVEQRKDGAVIFAGGVGANETFAFDGSYDYGTMGTEIVLFVNNTESCRIHTSCSQPIGPGLVCDSGTFEVVNGTSLRCGGPLCPVDDDDDVADDDHKRTIQKGGKKSSGGGGSKKKKTSGGGGGGGKKKKSGHHPPPPPPSEEPECSCCIPHEPPCVRGRQYWCHHHCHASRHDVWPLLHHGPHAAGRHGHCDTEEVSLCDKAWHWILCHPETGQNAWYELAHQFIPARLNIADGAPYNATELTLIADTEALLTQHCRTLPQEPEHEYALALRDALEDLNLGFGGPEYCRAMEDEDCEERRSRGGKHGHRD